MAGRFNGLNRAQWRMLKPLFSTPSKMGRPGVSWKRICNSVLWILITGARWCDLPKGRQWASRSTAHRWLGHWEVNGTLNTVLQKLRDCAEIAGLLNFERLSVDGFFFRRQRRRGACGSRLQGQGGHYSPISGWRG